MLLLSRAPTSLTETLRELSGINPHHQCLPNPAATERPKPNLALPTERIKSNKLAEAAKQRSGPADQSKEMLTGKKRGLKR